MNLNLKLKLNQTRVDLNGFVVKFELNLKVFKAFKKKMFQIDL